MKQQKKVKRKTLKENSEAEIVKQQKGLKVFIVEFYYYEVTVKTRMCLNFIAFPFWPNVNVLQKHILQKSNRTFINFIIIN